MVFVIAFLSKMALALAPYDSAVISEKIKNTQQFRRLRMSKNAPKIPKDAYAKAAKGEISTGIERVEGIEAGKGWGVAVFDAPIERLFAAVNDEEKHTYKSPIKHTEILEVGSCRDKRKVLMIMPTPIIKDRWWVTELRLNHLLKRSSNGLMRELTWNVIEDADALIEGATGAEKTKDGLQITFSNGSWLLIKLDDNHTLGEYYTWADPGGAIPAGPASMVISGQIEGFIQSIDHYVQHADSLPCLGKMK